MKKTAFRVMAVGLLATVMTMASSTLCLAQAKFVLAPQPIANASVTLNLPDVLFGFPNVPAPLDGPNSQLPEPPIHGPSNTLIPGVSFAMLLKIPSTISASLGITTEIFSALDFLRYPGIRPM